jgi:hypothetical protein
MLHVGGVTTVFKKYLATIAFIGIVVGKTFMALSQGFGAGRRHGAASSDNEQTPQGAIAMALANQNGILLAHILTTQQRLIDELIPKDQEDAAPVNTHEIACRPEHIDIVRKTLTPQTEAQFKELAFWATTTAPTYDLTIKSMSIEAERSGDVGRDHDIVLVFHVNGAGDNALRFQAEASRKLRDIGTEPGLRADVRWT